MINYHWNYLLPIIELIEDYVIKSISLKIDFKNE